MAKRYNACYVVVGKTTEKKFVCIESNSNDTSHLSSLVQKKHPKQDIVIKYIRESKSATSEAL